MIEGPGVRIASDSAETSAMTCSTVIPGGYSFFVVAMSGASTAFIPTI